MIRLLPLLAFALAPALVAAPAPHEPPPTFGARGTLTRNDLEKLKFDSRTDPDGAKREKHAERADDEEQVKRAGPPKPRPTNPFDVAVHMPATRVREGEPVPAYFALRNNRDRQLRLRSRIDVCDPEPGLRGEFCDVTVRDRATGKPVAHGARGATNCGAGALVVVPVDGFYCVKADLNWLIGYNLPPGQYEVSWRYGELRSAPVLFTVSKREGAKPTAPAKRPELRFYHLTDDTESDERSENSFKRGEPIRWCESDLTQVGTDDLAAALAVGQHGVFAPDIRSIPKADNFVEVWVEWLPYRDGDRVRVTLRAAPPHEEVRFEEVPQLYLMLEVPSSERTDQRVREEKKRIALERSHALVTPLTIEARLPDGWRDFSATPGAVRAAVLVAGGEIELPDYYGALRKQQLKEDRRADADERPVWRGFVRSDFTELRFQPLHLPAP